MELASINRHMQPVDSGICNMPACSEVSHHTSDRGVRKVGGCRRPSQQSAEFAIHHSGMSAAETRGWPALESVAGDSSQQQTLIHPRGLWTPLEPSAEYGVYLAPMRDGTTTHAYVCTCACTHTRPTQFFMTERP
jgi:hypothetical protein